MGIDEQGKLSNEAFIQKFVLNYENSTSQYLDTIKAMYKDISELKVSRTPCTNNDSMLNFKFYATIEDYERDLLLEFAKNLELELPEDFFDLGNLEKNLTSGLPGFGGSPVSGSKEEEEKYWLIKKLYATIWEYTDWTPIEKAFSNMKCLKIVLQNNGKAMDEDIEIILEIPKNALITIDKLPQFDEEQMRYLLNDCDMGVLFGIESTAEYMEYRAPEYESSHYSSSGYLPIINPDYSNDFVEELNEVFCYDIYENGDIYIVKLRIDYIKHNTSVAFPSILLLKEEISEIPYKITAKHNPNIFEGILDIKQLNV